MSKSRRSKGVHVVAMSPAHQRSLTQAVEELNGLIELLRQLVVELRERDERSERARKANRTRKVRQAEADGAEAARCILNNPAPLIPG